MPDGEQWQADSSDRADRSEARAREEHSFNLEEFGGLRDTIGHQATITANQHKGLDKRLRGLTLGGALGLALAGLVLTTALVAARNADESAERADRASACNTLLLGSVAAQQIDPRAVDFGCDTAVADELIARGLKRDAALADSQRETARRTCAFVALIPVPPADPDVLAFRDRLGCDR